MAKLTIYHESVALPQDILDAIPSDERVERETTTTPSTDSMSTTIITYPDDDVALKLKFI